MLGEYLYTGQFDIQDMWDMQDHNQLMIRLRKLWKYQVASKQASISSSYLFIIFVTTLPGYIKFYHHTNAFRFYSLALKIFFPVVNEFNLGRTNFRYCSECKI